MVEGWPSEQLRQGVQKDLTAGKQFDLGTFFILGEPLDLDGPPFPNPRPGTNLPASTELSFSPMHLRTLPFPWYSVYSRKTN